MIYTIRNKTLNQLVYGLFSSEILARKYMKKIRKTNPGYAYVLQERKL